jgi:hypothetical protein
VGPSPKYRVKTNTKKRRILKIEIRERLLCVCIVLLFGAFNEFVKIILRSMYLRHACTFKHHSAKGKDRAEHITEMRHRTFAVSIDAYSSIRVGDCKGGGS